MEIFQFLSGSVAVPAVSSLIEERFNLELLAIDRCSPGPGAFQSGHLKRVALDHSPEDGLNKTRIERIG